MYFPRVFSISIIFVLSFSFINSFTLITNSKNYQNIKHEINNYFTAYENLHLLEKALADSKHQDGVLFLDNKEEINAEEESSSGEVVKSNDGVVGSCFFVDINNYLSV